MDKLVIDGGTPLAGEVAHLRRQERRAADPVRGAADAGAADAQQRAAPERRAHDAVAARADGGEPLSADDGSLTLSAAAIEWPLAPYELVKTMRASILALGPAARALRRGARLAARRLRDRAAARRSARQGSAGDGRGDRSRSRLHRRQGEAADRRAIRVRHRHRDRHREPDDGRDARRGRDARSRTRRASRKSSISPSVSTRWARASPAPAAIASSSRASTRLHGATHAIMPDRIETGTFLARGRGRRRRGHAHRRARRHAARRCSRSSPRRAPRSQATTT